MPPAFTAKQAAELTFDAPITLTEVEDRDNRTRLEYHHYTVPLCAHPQSWIPMDSAIKTSYHGNGAPITIPGQTIDQDIYSTEEFQVFENTIRNNVEELIELYENRRVSVLRNTSFPSQIIHNIRRRDDAHRNDTYHSLLEIVAEHWESIKQLGRKRAHALLYTDLTNTGTPKDRDDVCMTACPHCGTGWWQFIPNDVKLSYLHTHDVYCPECFTAITDAASIGNKRIAARNFAEQDPSPPYDEVAPTIFA